MDPEGEDASNVGDVAESECERAMEARRREIRLESEREMQRMQGEMERIRLSFAADRRPPAALAVDDADESVDITMLEPVSREDDADEADEADDDVIETVEVEVERLQQEAGTAEAAREAFEAALPSLLKRRRITDKNKKDKKRGKKQNTRTRRAKPRHMLPAIDTASGPDDQARRTYAPVSDAARKLEVLARVLDRSIEYRGAVSTLRNEVNFDVSAEGLPRCVVRPGIYGLLSIVQSNKTSAIAVVAATSLVLGLPTVVLVKDLKGNVDDVRQKLGRLMAGVHDDPITIESMSGESAKWLEVRKSSSVCARFMAGRFVPVVICTAPAVDALQNFLVRCHAFGVSLLADEADAIWVHHLTDAGAG